MSAAPRVSVLIPTYNRAALLCEAVDSVLAQSFQDFEIVVVDDGSTDDTRARLAALIAREGARVRLIEAEHGGPARARNRAFAAARGEYVCILDSDDLYYPHKLALQVEHLDAHPDTVMVYTEFSAFDAAGYRDEFHLRTYHRSAYRGGRDYGDIFRERRPLTTSAVIGALAPAGSALAHWRQKFTWRGDIFEAYLFDTLVFTNSMMFRRSLLGRVSPQDPYFGHFHDLEFALRLCKAGTVAFIDNPTYKLRYHPGQVSLVGGAERDLNAAKLQRGLLRVARVHALGDAAYYRANRARVDALIARLCRAAAVPLMAYGGASRHRRKYFPRRARRYLRYGARHGAPARLLRVVTYLPTVAKQVFFRLQDVWTRRFGAGVAHA
jgi:glycosyltransferase involved in cell wall biosynthesis